MEIAEILKAVLDKEGRTRAWVVREMNRTDSEIQMNKDKFNSILSGRRKLKLGEGVAFCQALGISPGVLIVQEG